MVIHTRLPSAHIGVVERTNARHISQYLRGLQWGQSWKLRKYLHCQSRGSDWTQDCCIAFRSLQQTVYSIARKNNHKYGAYKDKQQWNVHQQLLLNNLILWNPRSPKKVMTLQLKFQSHLIHWRLMQSACVCQVAYTMFSSSI